MSKADENRVAKLLAGELGISFQDGGLNLDKWGQVDKWAKLSSNASVFIEVESGQKHPSTSVLKVWPYIEKKKKLRVFLIQCFLPKSPDVNSSRRRLAKWTAEKLEKEFRNRFLYATLTVSSVIKQKKQLLEQFKKFKSLLRR